MKYRRRTWRQFLTKIRFRGGRGGRFMPLYCDRCRIKDGLSQSGPMRFGTCSFCGRRTRCYAYAGAWSTGNNTVAHSQSTTWRWKRESPWLGFRTPRK